MNRILEEAQKLYNEGKWPEAVSLIGNNITSLANEEETAEAARIRGWCFYYMGTKGPEEKKMEMLDFSRGMFELVLNLSSDEKKRLSALNGLPLSLWILNRQQKAWEASDQAIEEFPDEPSAWNTRSILCRWAKDFQQAVDVCEKVYVTAVYRRDFRTAGHGKQNRGDALKELGRMKEAKEDYAAAVGFYKDFERETGQSAAFHVEGAQKKLLSISVANRSLD